MTPPLLLTQNGELREHGIWNWTLPAWVVRLADGRSFNVCPQAGACAKGCYAREGTYRFPAVRAAHLDNLRAAFAPSFPERMLNELRRDRYHPAGSPHLPELSRGHLAPEVARLLDLGAPLVRVHDSGDFFSEGYLRAWLTVAEHTPGVLFYAYTKEVALLERVGPEAPPNLLWIYSLGGRQDPLVDRDTMRHADVFPDEAAITAAGYASQDAHDLLSVVHPSHRIGIPANNLPAVNKRLAGRTFGQWEADQPRHRLTIRGGLLVSRPRVAIHATSGRCEVADGCELSGYHFHWRGSAYRSAFDGSMTPAEAAEFDADCAEDHRDREAARETQ